MNEDQILELFTFFQNEGWNVGQYNDFKGTLSDSTARKQMFDFFTEEGYDLGDVNALAPLNPVTTPSVEAPKAPQKPGTVENLDDILWKVPTPIKQKQEYTTKEAKAVLGEGFMEQFVPTDETTEYRLAEKFFADYPEPIKEATAQYFTSIDPKRKLYYDTKKNLTEKEKAEIAEAALLQKSKTAQSDVAILMNRVQQDPEKQKELQILQTIYNTEVTPENAEQIKELSAQIDPEGDAAQLLTKIAEAEGYADQYKEVLKQFPEEGLRRGRIKEQQASLLADPGDTWLDRANKQTVWAVSNAANSFLKAGVGLVKSTKTLADAVRGGETDAFTASDLVVEGLENFVDDYLKFQTPPAQIFKDGNYNGEAVIPGITTMLTDMAILLSGTATGAKLLGKSTSVAGKLSKELLATVPTSMALTFSDYYDTAKGEGLNDADAREAAGALAFANGLLEVISPNRVIKGLTPISVKGLIKAIDAGDLTAGKAIGFILKENGKELAQEYAQMASDKVIGGMYNQAHERDIFDDEFNLDEIKETALLTIAATTLIGAPAVSANWNDVQKGAAEELKGRMKTFGEQLNRMIENKEITYDKAQQLYSSVEKFQPDKDRAFKLLEQDAEEFIENAAESTPKEGKSTRRKKQQPYTLYKFADVAPEGYETVEIEGETYHKVPDNVSVSPRYPYRKTKTVEGMLGTIVQYFSHTGKLHRQGERFFIQTYTDKIFLPVKATDLWEDVSFPVPKTEQLTSDTTKTEVEGTKTIQESPTPEVEEKKAPAEKVSTNKDSTNGTPAKTLLGKKVTTPDGKVGILRKLNDNEFYLKTPDGTVKFDKGKTTVEELGLTEVTKKPVESVINQLKQKTEELKQTQQAPTQEVNEPVKEEPAAKKLKSVPEPPPTVQGNVLVSPKQLGSFKGEVQGEEIDFKALKEGDGVEYGGRTFKVFARKKDGSLKLWSPERNEWVDGATKSEITKTGEYVQVQKEEVSNDSEETSGITFYDVEPYTEFTKEVDSAFLSAKTKDEAKALFKKLAIKYHPDKGIYPVEYMQYIVRMMDNWGKKENIVDIFAGMTDDEWLDWFITQLTRPKPPSEAEKERRRKEGEAIRERSRKSLLHDMAGLFRISDSQAIPVDQVLEAVDLGYIRARDFLKRHPFGKTILNAVPNTAWEKYFKLEVVDNLNGANAAVGILEDGTISNIKINRGTTLDLAALTDVVVHEIIHKLTFSLLTGKPEDASAIGFPKNYFIKNRNKLEKVFEEAKAQYKGGNKKVEYALSNIYEFAANFANNKEFVRFLEDLDSKVEVKVQKEEWVGKRKEYFEWLLEALNDFFAAIFSGREYKAPPREKRVRNTYYETQFENKKGELFKEYKDALYNLAQTYSYTDTYVREFLLTKVNTEDMRGRMFGDTSDGPLMMAENTEDLSQITQEVFGLGKEQADAAASVMDRLIATMARRAGKTKADIYKTLSFQKLREAPKGVLNQIKAWHGSPYLFDKFRTEQIGTREGAQAFGWGLYFTDVKDIARYYAERLGDLMVDGEPFLKILENSETTPSSKQKIKETYNLLKGKALADGVPFTDYKSLKSYIESDALYNWTNGVFAKAKLNKLIGSVDGFFNYAQDILEIAKKTKPKTTRALFEVTLHKGKTPEEYTWLEWGDIVPESSISKINEAIAQFDLRVTYGMKGEQVYNELVGIASENRFKFDKKYHLEEPAKIASLLLLENGIDGIKYPSESIARGTTIDTARGFNYVVFDENAVSIGEVIRFQNDIEEFDKPGFFTRSGIPIGYEYDTKLTARERFKISELTQIGAGSDRVVFDLGGDKVLKVAKTLRGLEQNAYEGDSWSGIFPDVYERGLNYVVVDKVGKPDANTKALVKALQPFDQYDFDNRIPMLQEVLTEWGLDDVMNYDLLWGDFKRIANWGTKDGKPVHLDGGTMGGVAFIHESRERRKAGLKDLSDPEFREIYNVSRRLKKEFRETDKWTKFQEGENKARGAVRLFNDGQAVVYALTDPDVSTPLHEMAHVFEHYLTQEERQVVMESAGQPEWNKKTSEFFASGFERYLATSRAPSNPLQKIFEKFAKWLKDLYGSVDNVSPRMQEIYDRMLNEGQETTPPAKTSNEFADIIDGWYSPIEKRLSETKIERQSAKKWLEFIGGKDEAIYTGVKGWLESKKPNDVVSKREVLDFMKNNRVEIMVITKGRDESRAVAIREELYPLLEKVDASPDLISVLSEYAQKHNNYSFQTLMEEAIASSWDLPQDDLPNVGFDKEYGKIITLLREDYQDVESLPKWGGLPDQQLQGEKTNYKEIVVTIPKLGFNDDSTAPPPNFQSAHWDEPNVVVHLRMNTREDIEGNKTLFLEELQSDWAQIGRKEGFKEYSESDVVKLQREVETLTDELEKPLPEKIKSALEVQNSFGVRTFIYEDGSEVLYKPTTGDMLPNKGNIIERKDLPKEVRDAMDAITLFSKKEDENRNKLRELKSILFGIKSKSPPKGPFVTNTAAWVKLGLKVALREASKQGVSKFAWISGEQQNERNNLGSVVESIITTPTENGREVQLLLSPGRSTLTVGKDGVIEGESGYTLNVVGKPLSEVIGVELAEKVMVTSDRVISGDGLKLRGKGMLTFYDKLVPDTVKALTKELTGKPSEIGITTLKEGSKQQSIIITPQIVAAVRGGMPLFQPPKDVTGTNDSAKTQDFFSDVVTGESAKYKPSKEWSPLLNFTQSERKFKVEYDRFMGLFDVHIATSIPTFRETQVKVGNAIVEMLPNGGLVYDIGGSEGGFVKAISKVSGGKIKTVNLDPNPDMKKVHEATPVKGSTFVQEAFFEGFEDDGVVYTKHEPKRKADVVHESMVFQFITPDRSDFVKEVKRYLKPDGVFLTEEKFSQEDTLYEENEAKKAEYKDQYYTKEQQAVKTDDVLVGMKKNQTDLVNYKKILSENFKYVEEYWDAGNFRGFVASDSKRAVTTFTNKVGKITSEFSEKSTTAAAEPLNKGVFTNTPVESVIAVHEKYTGKTLPSRRNITLDTQQGMRIADEYERMEHAPDNPEVKRAYRVMVSETIAQYEALLDAGFTFTLFPGEGEPYKNSAEMMDDLRNNKHIFILPTQKAHGSGGFDSKENPLLENSGKKDANGEELLVNDLFRAVHDVFGHSLWGNSFGPIGEEIAWEIHSDMYSPEARRAVTTETRGQNSWANFGPHMRIDGRVPKKGEPGYVPLSERRFADQKVGLLPEWVSSSKTNIEIARENLKQAWNNLKTTGAIYDPEVELEKQRQLWKALFEYATAWLKDKVNPRYYDFKRTLPDGLEFPEEGIRAAFNQDINYEQKIEKQAPKTRKSAKRFLAVENQPKYLKDSIKRDGLRYFSVPVRVTDQAAEAYLEEFGPEKAAEMIINATGEMPMDVEILLGMKVRNILAAMAAKAKTKAEEARLYALADAVMNKNVKKGTELGRAINIFKEWASSDPKGVVLWTNRLASNMRERLTSRYRVPLEKAMATVEQINKEAADAVIFPEELTTFGYTKEDIRKKKAEAKKKLVDKLRSTASAVGPLNALPEIIEYGFFVFLDGANTFQRWSNEMRKAGVSDNTLLKDVWDNQATPLNQPLNALATTDDIKDALGTANLEAALRNRGVRNPAQVAAQLNKRYAEKLKSIARTKFNAISKQDKVNKAILKAAESGERITRDMLDRAFTENDVTLTPEIEAEILEIAKQLQAAPEGFKKDELSVRLVTMVHQNTGGESFSDTPTAMYYGAMLSAPATHVANAFGSLYNLLFDKIPLTLAQAALTPGIPRRKVVSDMLQGIKEGLVRGLMEANNVFLTGIPAKKESTKYHKELGPLEKYTWDYLKKRGFKWGDLVALMGAHPLWLKYVPRMLGATDAFFYQVFSEFYKPFAAAIVAKETGQPYEAVYRPMARVAAVQQAWSEISTAPLTPEIETKALAGKLDPKVKGWSKRDFNRRVREIEDQARDAYDVRVEQEANEFAQRGTFNYKPEGVLGVFANMIDTGAHHFLPLRLVVPFTNIVANVVNEQLDWTPIGILRATGYKNPVYGGSVLQQLQKITSGGIAATTAPKTEAEYQRMLMRGFIGTTMMVGLAAWVLGSLDDEDDFITVYGKGPGDYKQNKQWKADGNMPYSIRIGKKHFSYQYTPQGFLLTIIGNMADAYRYDRDQIFDEAGNVIGYEGGNALSMAAFRSAVAAAPGAILNMAFLKGLADLLEAFTDATEKGNTKPLERFMIRVGTTPFPNFFRAMEKAALKAYGEPTEFETGTTTENILQSVPIYGRIGREILDIEGKQKIDFWGRPYERTTSASGVVTGIGRIYKSKGKNTEVIDFLEGKGIFPTEPGRRKMNDGPMDDDEYYTFKKLSGKALEKDLTAYLPQMQNMSQEKLEKFVKTRTGIVRTKVQNMLKSGRTEEQIMQMLGI